MSRLAYSAIIAALSLVTLSVVASPAQQGDMRLSLLPIPVVSYHTPPINGMHTAVRIDSTILGLWGGSIPTSDSTSVDVLFSQAIRGGGAVDSATMINDSSSTPTQPCSLRILGSRVVAIWNSRGGHLCLRLLDGNGRPVGPVIHAPSEVELDTARQFELLADSAGRLYFVTAGQIATVWYNDMKVTGGEAKIYELDTTAATIVLYQTHSSPWFNDTILIRSKGPRLERQGTIWMYRHANGLIDPRPLPAWLMREKHPFRIEHDSELVRMIPAADSIRIYYYSSIFDTLAGREWSVPAHPGKSYINFCSTYLFRDSLGRLGTQVGYIHTTGLQSGIEYALQLYRLVIDTAGNAILLDGTDPVHLTLYENLGSSGNVTGMACAGRIGDLGLGRIVLGYAIVGHLGDQPNNHQGQVIRFTDSMGRIIPADHLNAVSTDVVDHLNLADTIRRYHPETRSIADSGRSLLLVIDGSDTTTLSAPLALHRSVRYYDTVCTLPTIALWNDTLLVAWTRVINPAQTELYRLISPDDDSLVLLGRSINQGSHAEFFQGYRDVSQTYRLQSSPGFFWIDENFSDVSTTGIGSSNLRVTGTTHRKVHYATPGGWKTVCAISGPHDGSFYAPSVMTDPSVTRVDVHIGNGYVIVPDMHYIARKQDDDLLRLSGSYSRLQKNSPPFIPRPAGAFAIDTTDRILVWHDSARLISVQGAMLATYRFASDGVTRDSSVVVRGYDSSWLRLVRDSDRIGIERFDWPASPGSSASTAVPADRWGAVRFLFHPSTRIVGLVWPSESEVHLSLYDADLKHLLDTVVNVSPGVAVAMPDAIFRGDTLHAVWVDSRDGSSEIYSNRWTLPQWVKDSVRGRTTVTPGDTGTNRQDSSRHDTTAPAVERIIATPIPVRDNLTIGFVADRDGEAVLTLIDSRGAMVRQLRLGAVISGNQEVRTISLATLPRGVYQLSVTGCGEPLRCIVVVSP